MIRHTVLFKFKSDFPPQERRAWVRGLDNLQGGIPGLLGLTHGADVAGTERSFDYAIVADFATLADIEVYNNHPLHEPLKSYSFPNSKHIVSVDFVL